MRIEFLFKRYHLFLIFFFLKCYKKGNISTGTKESNKLKKIETVEQFEIRNKEIFKNEPYVPLFQIEKDGKKSYIFGTNHCIIDKYFPKVPDIVKEKIQECDYFFSEAHINCFSWEINNAIIERIYKKLKNTHLQSIATKILDLRNKNISKFYKDKKKSKIWFEFLIKSALLFPKYEIKNIENELSNIIFTKKNKYIGSLDIFPDHITRKDNHNKKIEEEIKKLKKFDTDINIKKEINLKIKSIKPLDIFLCDSDDKFSEDDKKFINNKVKLVCETLLKHVPKKYALLLNEKKEKELDKNESIRQWRLFYLKESLDYYNGDDLKHPFNNTLYLKNSDNWISKIFKIFETKQTDEELLDKRNQFWITKIKAYDNNSFFFVGLNHLVKNKNSLFDLLEKEGYKITNVSGIKYLNEFKSLLNNKTKKEDILELAAKYIKKINFNSYYSAYIKKLTAEKLGNILEKTQKDILDIVDIYISSAKWFVDAANVYKSFGYSRIDCVIQRDNIYNHLVLKYQTG